MPRKPRYFIPNIATHIVQRGHNEGPVFFKDEDYRYYLDYLQKAAKRYDCAIHSYILLENQVRILATPETDDGISRMMQYIGRYYVSYINGENNSSGTLWDGRFRSCIVQDSDSYILSSMRYIESTPIRFGLISNPVDLRWSSHHGNAYGKQDNILTHHASYLNLGRTPENRYKAYHDFCHQNIDQKASSEMCNAWRSGIPLGNESFKKMIEQKLKCKIKNDKPGRPKKIESSNTILSLYGGLFKSYTLKTAKRG